MPSSGGLRLRAAEFAAHGLLCAGRDRARRARARRRSTAAPTSISASGTTRWNTAPTARWRCGSASGRSTASAKTGRERIVEDRGNGYARCATCLRRERACRKRALIILAEADGFRSFAHGPPRGAYGRCAGSPTTHRCRCSPRSSSKNCRPKHIAPLPAHAAQRTCAGRLSDAASVAAGPSDAVPARSVPLRRRQELRRDRQSPRWRACQLRRHRAVRADAGRCRRRVHHAQR